MASAFSTVIAIRPADSTFAFYSAVGNDKSSIKEVIKNYKARQFDEEFFAEFSRCLKEYATSNPSYSGKAAKVTILLPNRFILSDSFNIPGVSKRNTSNLFSVAFEGRYTNHRDLKYQKFVSAQNKQYTTISVTLIRQKLLQQIYAACSSCNMFADIVTYNSNAAANAVMALNTKHKNASFYLLDIKETSASISFVAKGVTLGCFDLPFGWNILHDSKLTPENMLFDYSVAELAVLNAKEKAKAKALTIMSDAESPNNGEDQAEEEESTLSFTAPETIQTRQVQIKTLGKKTPRVLPKFMQRPLPETPEGFVYENFRIFEKWMLEFIRANPRLTAIAAPDTVYVNMPEQFNHLFPTLAAEEKENGVKFVSLGLEKEKEVISQNLELFGGLYAGSFNSQNNF